MDIRLYIYLLRYKLNPIFRTKLVLCSKPTQCLQFSVGFGRSYFKYGVDLYITAIMSNQQMHQASKEIFDSTNVMHLIVILFDFMTIATNKRLFNHFKFYLTSVCKNIYIYFFKIYFTCNAKTKQNQVMIIIIIFICCTNTIYKTTIKLGKQLKMIPSYFFSFQKKFYIVNN